MLPPLPFPVGPNTWNLLHLYLHTQLPLAPSSWSTNRPDSLLPKKKKKKSFHSTTSSFFNLNDLHLLISQIFLYFSSFIIPVILCPMPTLNFQCQEKWSCSAFLILTSLKILRNIKLFFILKNTDLFPQPGTISLSLLLWHYTQILSQPQYRPFFFSCTAFSEFHTHVSKWPQEDKSAKRWPRNVQGDQRRILKHLMSQKPRNKQGRKWIPIESNNSE